MKHLTQISGRRQAASSQSPPILLGPNVDLREQLVNDGTIGPITAVSLPEAVITRLRGIMLDIDPRILAVQLIGKVANQHPTRFYENVLGQWLQRHPVLTKAQVRCSGTGLHVLLLLDTPIEIATETERQRWALIVKIIQRCLPSDPDAPGITAMTRPIGSINGKNGSKVTMIAPGQPVTAAELLALFMEMHGTPVRTVTRILFGQDRITPCPICHKEGTSLGVLDRSAKCYGACGTVKLSQIFDLFYAPRAKARE